MFPYFAASPQLPSWFAFHTKQEVINIGLQPSEDDILFDHITESSQLMNGSVPWRGAWEKDPMLMQMLIESIQSLKMWNLMSTYLQVHVLI